MQLRRTDPATEARRNAARPDGQNQAGKAEDSYRKRNCQASTLNQESERPPDFPTGYFESRGQIRAAGARRTAVRPDRDGARLAAARKAETTKLRLVQTKIQNWATNQSQNRGWAAEGARRTAFRPDRAGMSRLAARQDGTTEPRPAQTMTRNWASTGKRQSRAAR